jgi:hypothetical protein
MTNFTWDFSSKSAETVEQGWHRLTAAGVRAGWSRVNLNETIDPVGQVLRLAFDYLSWGGANPVHPAGADGLALYLFDAGVPNAGTGHFIGGTLGYSGIPGAYIGVGLDEFGNFSHIIVNKGRSDGPFTPNAVAIRGSAERNWGFVENFKLTEPLSYPGPKYTNRQQVIDAGGIKHVVAQFTPKKYRPGYTVHLSINNQPVIENFDYPYPAPASLKVGVSAANGSATNHHEIRNLQLDVRPAVDTGTNDCPANGNLVRGVPAYISLGSPNFEVFYYPQLNDGDHVHQGWDGSGKWGNRISGAAAYSLDLSGAECQDLDGACAAGPGKGGVELNTLVIYSRQDGHKQQEPTETTTFTEHGAIDFHIIGQLENTEEWLDLATVAGNDLVKCTITVPRGRYWRLQVSVDRAASDGPSIVGLEAYDR